MAAAAHADRLATADFQPGRRADAHAAAASSSSRKPRIFSLVTGDYGYTATNARELLYRWIDHPQRLWDAVYETLASGVTTVIHLGPDPNIIPATFRRLSEDVASQMHDSRSLRALSAAVRRQWLRRLLPQRAACCERPTSSTSFWRTGCWRMRPPR